MYSVCRAVARETQTSYEANLLHYKTYPQLDNPRAICCIRMPCLASDSSPADPLGRSVFESHQYGLSSSRRGKPHRFRATCLAKDAVDARPTDLQALSNLRCTNALIPERTRLCGLHSCCR